MYVCVSIPLCSIVCVLLWSKLPEINTMMMMIIFVDSRNMPISWELHELWKKIMKLEYTRMC